MAKKKTLEVKEVSETVEETAEKEVVYSDRGEMEQINLTEVGQKTTGIYRGVSPDGVLIESDKVRVIKDEFLEKLFLENKMEEVEIEIEFLGYSEKLSRNTFEIKA